MLQTAKPVGTLLREWRERRRLTQLGLALEADISPRHLSFVETGRSQPSREMLLHLSEELDIPLRERNVLLVAAGFAPTFRERSLQDDELEAARRVIDLVLEAQKPFRLRVPRTRRQGARRTRARRTLQDRARRRAAVLPQHHDRIRHAARRHALRARDRILLRRGRRNRTVRSP